MKENISSQSQEEGILGTQRIHPAKSKGTHHSREDCWCAAGLQSLLPQQVTGFTVHHPQGVLEDWKNKVSAGSMRPVALRQEFKCRLESKSSRVSKGPAVICSHWVLPPACDVCWQFPTACSALTHCMSWPKCHMHYEDFPERSAQPDPSLPCTPLECTALNCYLVLSSSETIANCKGMSLGIEMLFKKQI